MRILITNDDGIFDKGLLPLVKWAKKLGEVVVVAPKTGQSGKSQAINLFCPIEIKKVDICNGIDAYSMDSTPADCIRFAMKNIEKPFDLIISGINCGLNDGENIAYSGTVGAIFEAAFFNIKSVAISTQIHSIDTAHMHLDKIYDYFVDNKLFEANCAYNVNIPAEVNGIKITRQGGAYFRDEFSPLGDDMYICKGNCVYVNAHNHEIDMDAVSDGYISITPLSNERTNVEVFNKLRKLNGK